MLRSTKRTSVEITLVFCFARHPKSHSRGWIRTAAATSLKMAQKQPGGLFLAARLATSTRAHQKTSTYESALRFLFCDKAKLIGRVDSNSCGDIAEDGAKTARWAVFSSAARESTRAHQKTSTYVSTLRFLFCDKAKLIGRVDSNSCGTVQQDDLQQCKDQQNNKNHSVPCIIIFCNGIQVGTLCIDFLNFSSKKSLTMLSVHDKITFDFERQSMAESFQSNLPWTAQRG